MNFLADESIDRAITERLRQDGHEVQDVAEMAAGSTDEAVLSWAVQENAILITADKDFGEMVFRQHRLVTGVVLLRLPGLPSGMKADIVAFAVKEHGAKLPNAFSVIKPGATRIRPRQWSSGNGHNQ